ncbi:ankyrin repeat domain-containing protein [Sphingomonas sabuli]|uniref:Ankyrin repeat domain-containing protein n=1 Tax=Sphingomonas sabuli TaxID=2764186 RepID=A0A7G9L0F9_9SPHN|nr:ankyrin repeat domain-containing protein [Sphingomonas sabuli]QNM82108.1 ankyrin repeat domain-containing protein [Sphingomonas sabuli]
MKALKRTIVAIAAAAIAIPAAAQTVPGNEANDFVAAIRKGDGNKGLALLGANPTLANVRDTSGNTALVTAIEAREESWVGHLLKNGANPNFSRRDGETPLIAAARMGMTDVAEWLVGVGAKVDAANRMGETALIVAVQQRQTALVRYLLQKGADPDLTDSAAGYSARDYAKRDNRNPEILRLIEQKKPKA